MCVWHLNSVHFFLLNGFFFLFFAYITVPPYLCTPCICELHFVHRFLIFFTWFFFFIFGGVDIYIYIRLSTWDLALYPFSFSFWVLDTWFSYFVSFCGISNLESWISHSLIFRLLTHIHNLALHCGRILWCLNSVTSLDFFCGLCCCRFWLFWTLRSRRCVLLCLYVQRSPRCISLCLRA